MRLRSVFQSRIDQGKIVINNRDVVNHPYPNHVQAEINMIEGDEYQLMGGHSRAAENMLAHNARLRSFFDEMGFSQTARIRLAEAFIQVGMDLGPECFVAHEQFGGISTSGRNIEFTALDYPPEEYHTRPLYVEATINTTQFKRALVDCGASLNLLPLTTFKAAGLSANKVVQRSVRVAGFGQQEQKTLGYILLSLNVGGITAPTRFHIIEANTSYHMILGRPWIHWHKAVPSSYFHCVKLIHRGKPYTIKGTEHPFEAHEAHLIRPGDQDIPLEHPPHWRETSTCLPKWETLDGRKINRIPALVRDETPGKEIRSKQKCEEGQLKEEDGKQATKPVVGTTGPPNVWKRKKEEPLVQTVIKRGKMVQIL
jgi:gag-polyprotein putative aspartyl protease